MYGAGPSVGHVGVFGGLHHVGGVVRRDVDALGEVKAGGLHEIYELYGDVDATMILRERGALEVEGAQAPGTAGVVAVDERHDEADERLLVGPCPDVRCCRMKDAPSKRAGVLSSFGLRQESK